MVTSLDLERIADEHTEIYASKFSIKTEQEERDYKEKEQETHRTRYRRDRDRILYSNAFRRLQFKTQVFVNSTGDNYRTRLTHSMEVEQLATSIAKALKLNEDLVSAISYGHDLGHTPFGHAVEEKLNEYMKDCGGFLHSVQSVRVVELLEKYRTKDFPGLNLSSAVREGILKHNHDFYNNFQQHNCSHLNPNNPSSIESEVVYFCDKLAYVTHDLDDAINSGLIRYLIEEGITNSDELNQLWGMLDLTYNEHSIRDIIRILLDDFIKGSLQLLSKYKRTGLLTSSENIKTWDITTNPLLAFEKHIEAYNKLKNFHNLKICKCKYILESDKKAQEMVDVLFNRYIKDKTLLPKETQNKMNNTDCDCPRRVIIDHIAGMTDRYAVDQFQKLFLFIPFERKWRKGNE